MPVYAYKGLNAKGKQVSGIHDTESPRSLRSELRQQKVYLTEYVEKDASGQKKDAVVATGKKEAGSREVTISFMQRIPSHCSGMTPAPTLWGPECLLLIH